MMHLHQAVIHTLAQTNEGWIQSVLLVTGLALVVASLVVSIRKKRGRIGQHRATAQEHIERSKQTRAVGHDLEELMAEVEQLSRRMGSSLDAKSMRLEQLIRQADARIAKLQQFQGHAPPPAAGSSSASPGHAPDGHPSAYHVPGGHAPASPSPGGQPGAARPASSPGVAAGVAPPDSGDPSNERPADESHQGQAEDDPAKSDPITRQVYALADAGVSPEEIARKLDQHLGSVELILALRSG